MIKAEDLNTPLDAAAQIADAVRSAKVDTLAEYTSPTRLSPVVLIDKAVLSVDTELTRALLQTLLSIYTGHYLQAINISMNVGNIDVMRTLDKFSTDRDILSAAGVSGEVWSLEGLVDVPSEIHTMPKWGEGAKRSISLEAKNDNLTSIHDENNLAVGKIITVDFTADETTITVPISVSLTPKSIPSKDIIAITSNQNLDKSLSGRFHAWRSGEIRFLQDYLLCQDLIEADRKALKADSSGTLSSLRSKRTKNILASVISLSASPNAVSAMQIVSKETAREMEVALKGKLKSSRVRDKFWASNALAMLVVVDIAMERFTLYQRGIDDAGQYTLDDIKSNDKNGNGVDIDSVLKAYKLGEAPTL